MIGRSFASRRFPPVALLRALAVTALTMLATADVTQRARAALALVIRYPSPDAQIGAVRSSFVFGAAPPGAAVTVNGTSALVAPDGGWIAYVPFSSGRFALRVHASLGDESADALEYVAVETSATPAFPASTTIVAVGESIALAVAAPSGSSVTVSGPGFSGIALRSTDDGAFAATIDSAQAGGPTPVVYHIVSPEGVRRDVVSDATLEVAAQEPLYTGVVIPYEPDPESGFRPYGLLAPAPYADTTLTEPVGTPLAVTGRRGNYLRVHLGDLGDLWIDRREVAQPGASPAPETEPALDPARWQIYTIALRERAPFRVDEDVEHATLRLTVVGAGLRGADATWTFAPRQRTLWGYRTWWSGDRLLLAVKKPPGFASAPRPALDGLLVVVDPGHSPDTGAIGPLGTTEREVNLDIATRLAQSLRAKGARVVMTRTDSEPVLLYDRPKLAESLDADVLISVHNNAWPDGVDPTTAHGFTIYYYQPHSLALAQAMHAAYSRDMDLPDQGVHTGDFALVRSSQLPSVLTESAFITWPWEEMDLREPAFRQRLAATMANGLERWAESMRTLESDR